MRNKPICSRCGRQHWYFVRCDNAEARDQTEQHNARTRKPITRPRDGYLEFGDRLAPDTERVGHTTFAIRRKPGERVGSFRR